MSPPTPRRVDRAKIEGLLAITLGEERGKSTWEDAAVRLGVPPGETYSVEEATLVLDSLVVAPGVVGVAARFARVRVDQGRGMVSGPRRFSSVGGILAVRPVTAPSAPPRASTPHPPPPSAPPRASTPHPSMPPTPASSPPAPVRTDAPQPSSPPPTSTVPPASAPRVDVPALLKQALGEAKAKQSVAEYARALKLDPDALSRDDAVKLLETMAAATGLVGVAASFAKVRFLLRSRA